KTKAIVPVHLYGQPVDMDPILEIADKYNLFVIEDAAHAPGGRYKGRKCGNLGSVGCFSFHEQKNMATGEGGMITTSDYELYQRARLYKSHCAMVVGGSSKYLQLPPEAEERALASKRYWFQDFADCGYNFRISDLTAAIGICQLKKLDNMNEIRNKLAWEFTKRLDEVEGIAPLKKIEDVYHTYHLYPVILDKEFIHQKNLSREDIIYALRMKYRIKVGVHYMPLVETTAFMNRGYSQKDSPIAYERWPLLITLPIHPRLTQEGVDYLFDSLSQIMK
ncbi:MAG: DegT/DnrJ/EryC1/StrS family aminotransferase, partial [Promethearchaeota archaeon]